MSEAIAHGPAAAGPTGRALSARREELRAVLERYGVSNVQVFGSVARGKDSQDSDLDLLVDLPPDLGLFALAGIIDELESIVGARVDLVSRSSLRGQVRDRIEADLLPL